MKGRGLNADFRATGQTGIFIAGDGVSIDAVVSDSSRARRVAVSGGDPDHWDLVKGRGRCSTPHTPAVTLGLITAPSPTRW